MLLLALCLIASSCSGDDGPTVTNDPVATPRPAPTIEGVATELSSAAVAAQAVVVAVDATTLIEVRAQPGVDQPLVGEVPAGDLIQPLGPTFTTSDELVWWQVRAGDLQGWTPARLAYQGPAMVTPLASGTSYGSPAEAAAAIASEIGASLGATQEVTVATTELLDQGRVTITSDLVLGEGARTAVRVIVATQAFGPSADSWQAVTLTQFDLCENGVNAQGICL